MDFIEYTVCQHFLPALINGDESGLEQEALEALHAWVEREDFDLTKGHFDSDDESHFDYCSIMGEEGDVVTLRWVIREDA